MLMEHIFRKSLEGAPTFLLLHGTGGDEKDLLPLAESLNVNYNVLSVRGEISEGGMNRFFKRHGEGQYDVEDLNYRTQQLIEFIKEAAEQYDFDIDNIIPVGFSNGSNIAISMMLKGDITFKKALLYAPLYPLEISSDHDFSAVTLLLSMGKNDPIVPVEQSERLERIFTGLGADVKTVWVNSHELTPAGVYFGKEVLEK
jgi:phospholipase/carboxylesterase